MAVQDIKKYKASDLVLNVNKNFDPQKLNLRKWDYFLEVLCRDREYQKKAIQDAIIFLASGQYQSIKNLVEENYQRNSELQSKYASLPEYYSKLQLPEKLFANIDLATGTGKSYVIYGIAQIILGLGLVDMVLVLCPSRTIEAGLIEKFQQLSGNSEIKEALPDGIKHKNPRIVSSNVTIKDGDICIENIHAVYERTGSSIEDSLKNDGNRTLVLNDESHHIFNKMAGREKKNQSIKKWKEFLLSKEYGFQYMLGFTGTAYVDDEYFNDVIYRYSLREAIQERMVKNIEYVQKDDSLNQDEKFQKIHQNHTENKNKYSQIKPLSILITKDISNAKQLKEDLIDFLVKKEKTLREQLEEKILIVTSAGEHEANVLKLKDVDDQASPTEWIISVSMLTEGWDVKNVFQIVPWEDRAFNSKLLIAQVLGRGLRIPEVYSTPQPRVIVFNHDAWSKNIRSLVDEVLEIETRVVSEVLKIGQRSRYNFTVYNIKYDRKAKEEKNTSNEKSRDYSRIEREGIKLESQVEKIQKETTYESASTLEVRDITYDIKYGTYPVEDIIDHIYEEFRIRDWEGMVLKLGQEEYSKNKLPPRHKIEDIIRNSMQKVGIKGDGLVEKNKNNVLRAFATLLRKSSKYITYDLEIEKPFEISIRDINQETAGIANFKRDSSLFYTDKYKEEIADIDQQNIISSIIEDPNLPRKASSEQNSFLFKTPLNIVITNSDAEKSFVENLCKKDVSNKIDAWLKSRDRGFYSIEYTIHYGPQRSTGGKRSKVKTFNPDFVIKISQDQTEYIIIVEIKSNGDDSDENKTKYQYSLDHFEELNAKLSEQKINQKYIFHFLSPNSYDEFFTYLKDGRLLKEQFRSELENLLENGN